MASKKTGQALVVNRLNRIAGQVSGVARMIEDERYCIDILTQIQAVRAALSKVEDAVLANHAASCVEDAIKARDVKEQRRKFEELVALFGRTKR